MKPEVLSYVTEKTNELLNAATCCQDLKDAASAWLNAVGTEKEAEVTRQYIAELEEDIVTIDGLIAFAESDMGAKVFGDRAPSVAAEARESKAAGAKYCTCAACGLVEAILAKKDEMLA